jgi:hypothetical protein
LHIQLSYDDDHNDSQNTAQQHFKILQEIIGGNFRIYFIGLQSSRAMIVWLIDELIGV